MEIATANGIFAQYGIEAESIGFGGGGKMHQAMAAHQLDIALGSGPEMAAVAKGAPKALAVVGRSIVETGLIDHPVDMKGLYTEEFLP